MASSSVQSIRINYLVCRDKGEREEEKGKGREAARERGEMRD